MFFWYSSDSWKKVGDILNSNPDIVFAKDDKLEEHSASSIRSIIDVFDSLIALLGF